MRKGQNQTLILLPAGSPVGELPGRTEFSLADGFRVCKVSASEYRNQSESSDEDRRLTDERARLACLATLLPPLA